MKKTVIWDLDGTLLDSYPLIVASIHTMTQTFNTEYSPEFIHDAIIKDSVRSFIEFFSHEHGVDTAAIRKIMFEYSKENEHTIGLIDGAIHVLKTLNDRGYEHYVYTHNGLAAFDSLKRNGILDLFIEVVTSDNKFQRKPHPEALDYLIDKYDLDRNHSYYVGDRILDVECAKNAEIIAVYFTSMENAHKRADITVSRLVDILDYLN
ncbi:HAD-IA family hydrolase [Erysipelothrix sp. HDW6C]|uniref:HAD-IA family hydrolase n=1 Tax=Erysipelothrix sp. HDW6C TaxID=2714930 RepID=UPI00140CA386|nr:HAD-IA family hydrolase [Erysipelothrix sp. HDW6C]QIK69585.1 HAD-IA family hydrolase [Erysipelothrix sp. HDW6C]